MLRPALLTMLFLAVALTSPVSVRGQENGPDPQTAAFAIAIRDSVLKRIADRTTDRSDVVDTVILGAAVNGCQTTITDSGVDLIPGTDVARMQIVSRGHVRSQTTSLHPSARIEGTGTHSFVVVKSIEFDGRQFVTTPAWGTITARQHPTHVASVFSAMPLMGPLADQIAHAEVMRRLPETNQAVAADVARDVLKQVNRDVDEQLRLLNQDLLALTNHLESRALLASVDWSATSTDDALILLGVDASTASPQRPLPPRHLLTATRDDVVLTVSDTFVNLMAERLLPSNTMLSDSSLLAASTRLRPELLDWQTLATLKPPAETGPLLFGIELPETDAVRVRFDSGRIVARLTGRYVPRIGSPGDWMTTELSLQGESGSADYWVLRAVGEREAGDDAATTQNVGTAAGMALRSVTDGLTAALDGLSITRWIPLPVDGVRATRLQLTRIDCSHGLMQLGFRMDTPATDGSAVSGK